MKNNQNKGTRKPVSRNKGCSSCYRNQKTEKGMALRIDGMNPGCAACGSPFYPDCMDSCPLFDD